MHPQYHDRRIIEFVQMQINSDTLNKLHVRVLEQYEKMPWGG
jgi:hypothetical protein